MLELRVKGIDFRVSLLFPAALVVVLTLDQTSVPAWCIAASVMHEAGHFLALYALGDRPEAVCVGLFGVRVVRRPADPLNYRGTLLVALAGPLVNLIAFSVLYAAGGMSVPATVHLILGAFNLLPVGPLDGGQALFAAAAQRWDEQGAERLCQIVSVAVLIPLATLGFYLLIRSGYNFTLLAVSLYLGLLLLFKRR